MIRVLEIYNSYLYLCNHEETSAAKSSHQQITP